MKIAVINQPWNSIVPPVQTGSVAIITYETARRLARNNEVTIYARKWGDEKALERHENVEYRRFSTAWDRRLQRALAYISSWFDPKRPLFASRLFYYFYIRQIARDMRTRAYDVVHIHNLTQFVPIIRRYNPDVKIVLHMHCEWLNQLDRDMIGERLKETDFVINVCDYITQKLVERFPDFEARTATVHNGVSVDRFRPGDNGARKQKRGRRLIFVGRVSPEKGVHVMLDAFPKVLERHPDTELVIVGPVGSAPAEFIVGLSDDPKVMGLRPLFGRDYGAGLRRNLPPGVGERVTFAGDVPYLDLVRYYQESDIFILPSVWHEPFGMPIVEAMACGIPAVGTRGGGITDIIEDGITGLLVERADSDGLARALLRLIEDDDLRKTMGEAGRRRVVEQFSWDHMSDELLAVHNRLVDA